MSISDLIQAKSDQLNADDLVSGPITVTITGVRIKGGEQPVDIHITDNKPFRPSKTAMRILAFGWGDDEKKWVGRSMTLYRDPDVKWAGKPVGGIRISHMDGIDSDFSIALAETRGKKVEFRVKRLTTAKNAEALKRKDSVDRIIRVLKQEVTSPQDRASLYSGWQITDPRKLDQWTDETLKAASEYCDSLETSTEEKPDLY